MKDNNFVKENSSINEEENIIVEFGKKMIITTIVAFIVATVISLYMKMFLEGVLLLVSIIALRQYAGGYHAQSQKLCAVLSVLIYIMGLFVIKKIPMHSVIQLVMCVISTLIVFFLAPVDNLNNKLTCSEKKYIKNKVRTFLTIEIAAFVLFLIMGAEYWSEIIIISMIIVSILVLIGFIENKVRG